MLASKCHSRFGEESTHWDRKIGYSFCVGVLRSRVGLRCPSIYGGRKILSGNRKELIDFLMPLQFPCNGGKCWSLVSTAEYLFSHFGVSNWVSYWLVLRWLWVWWGGENLSTVNPSEVVRTEIMAHAEACQLRRLESLAEWCAESFSWATEGAFFRIRPPDSSPGSKDCFRKPFAIRLRESAGR